MSSQMGGDAGTQLKSALDALKAALPTQLTRRLNSERARPGRPDRART